MMTESEAGLSSCCPECVRPLEVTDLALGGEDQCPSSWARTQAYLETGTALGPLETSLALVFRESLTLSMPDVQC